MLKLYFALSVVLGVLCAFSGSALEAVVRLACFIPVTLVLAVHARIPTLTVACMGIAAMVYARPAILGESFGYVGAIACLVLLLVSIGRCWRPEFNRWVIMTAGYLGVALLARAYSRTLTGDVIQGSVVSVVYLLCGLVLSQERRAFRVFLAVATAAVALQTLAAALSTAFLRCADSCDRGWSFNLSYQGGRSYPYTITDSGAITVGSGGIFPGLGGRLTGWLGEPGAFAGVICLFAALDINLSGRFRMSRQVTYLAALAFTQSPLGLAAYLVLCVTANVWERSNLGKGHVRKGAGLLMLGSLIWAVPYLQEAKFEANEASYSGRLQGASLSELLSAWATHPFGTGGKGENSGVNLVQASIALGPIPLVCFLVILISIWRRAPQTRGVRSGIAALGLFMLLGQPLVSLWFVFLGCLLGLNAADKTAATSGPRAVSDLVATTESSRYKRLGHRGSLVRS